MDYVPNHGLQRLVHRLLRYLGISSPDGTCLKAGPFRNLRSREGTINCSQRKALPWRPANRRRKRSTTYNNTVICFSLTRIWNLDYQNRPDPTEITPFFRNFPDPTGSLLRRTGNALILGLDFCRCNTL